MPMHSIPDVGRSGDGKATPCGREARVPRNIPAPALPGAGERLVRWLRTGAGKAPHWIGLAHGRPFNFAGLWEAWGEVEARTESFTVLTCPAGEALAAVHTRPPAVLAPEGYAERLAPQPRREWGWSGVRTTARSSRP